MARGTVRAWCVFCVAGRRRQQALVAQCPGIKPPGRGSGFPGSQPPRFWFRGVLARQRAPGSLGPAGALPRGTGSSRAVHAAAAAVTSLAPAPVRRGRVPGVRVRRPVCTLSGLVGRPGTNPARAWRCVRIDVLVLGRSISEVVSLSWDRDAGMQHCSARRGADTTMDHGPRSTIAVYLDRPLNQATRQGSEAGTVHTCMYGP
jgi:hypothetical protein